MIHEVTGDILLTTAPAIAHGVAPNDPFHSGLALQLREKYPAMYKDFRHYCQSTHVKPGELWAWAGAAPTGHDGGAVRIVSLLTQSGGYEHGAKPGPATLEHVNHALKNLHRWLEEENPSALALPRLATGVGGLKWESVSPLVQQHLGKVRTPVFVYTTYRKGVQAAEQTKSGRA